MILTSPDKPIRTSFGLEARCRQILAEMNDADPKTPGDALIAATILRRLGKRRVTLR